MTPSRRLAAEALGTFSLLATVIGSGIMAERLADGNLALALLGNTIPTGAILVVLITVFGPISGLGQWIGEFIATFGLIGTILICVTLRPAALAMSVGLYITAAYWFTSSTSFANPAVTIARGFSDSFAGITPSDIPAFIAAQLIAAVLATMFFAWLLREAETPTSQ